ncbi:MAG: 2,3-dihydroxy-2,3-dihydrophenylpropionate dehydrogenase [Thermoleophilaceae bacterium]|nr:2,3-dihydroxy-2,3-dihydrophenylpropionate dehydrogenase [Thermoleophilaceae bacterium]
MTGWLEGQVALVTGGGSGIGRAIVERFVTEGARVGVLDISQSKLDAVEAALGDSVRTHRGDATVAATNEEAVAATLAAFGQLDVFVANAGLWDFATSLEDLAIDDIGPAFDELFAVNVKAGLMGARAALEPLRATRGSMIFTLSNAAFHPGGGGPLYTASKHAIVGVVRQLAYELAPEIRVNGVAPGGMATDLRGPSALGQEATPYGSLPVDEIMRRWSPLEIAPQPEDYTGHYVLLASRADARTVTGAVHVCDGGEAVRGRRAAEALEQDVMGADGPA